MADRPFLPTVVAQLTTVAGIGTQAMLTWMRQVTSTLTEVQAGTATPEARQLVTPTGSPFTYTAARSGYLYLAGGTVSNVQFIRAGAPLTVAYSTAGQIFPLSAGDSLKITYSSAPTTLYFIPN